MKTTVDISTLEKTRSTFLAILIPPEVSEPLLHLMRQYWPTYTSLPHITLLDPFVLPCHFDIAEEALSEKLKQVAPFEVTLTEFGHFSQRRGSVLWVKPVSLHNSVDQLENLQYTLMLAFPQCTEVIRGGRFKPHVTVGRFQHNDGASKAMETLDGAAKGFPIRFTVKEVQIFSKEDTPTYHVKKTIPLSGCQETP